MPSSVEAAANFSNTWAVLRGRVQRFLRLLKRRWWVVMLTMSVGLAAAAWYVSQLPAAYLSQARMMVSGKINLPEASSTMYSEEAANFFGTQIELMQSGDVKNRAQERVLALSPELQPLPVNLQVGQQPKTSIFVLRATGPDPVYTQKFLNACMDEYIKVKKSMRSQKSDSTESALGGELVRLEKELREGDEELLAFQKENNIGYLKEEGNSAAAYLSSLNREHADLKKRYQLLEKLDLDQTLDRHAGQPAADEGAAAGDEQVPKTDNSDSALAEIGPASDYLKEKQQLQLLIAKRDQFAEVMRPRHPTMIELNDEISRTQKLIQTFRAQSVEQLKLRREAMALELANLESVIKDWENKASDLSRRIAEYDKVRGKVERVRAQYDRLFGSLKNLESTESLDQDVISVLERASAPISVKPGLVRGVLIGVCAGALLGLAILFLMDRIDDKLTSYAEVQGHFADQQILGQVTQEKSTEGRLALLEHDDQRHAFAESFRTIRSSLLYLPMEGERPKTLLVTSSVPSEGKSTVAANLAISMAFAGSRTLLVDGDLRRGGLHDTFQVSNEKGFAEVLKQQVDWSEVIHATPFENVSLLTRGHSPKHPAELLLSPSADRFLREVYAQFDHVIIDSSPVMVADDTTSFAPKIDAVLFVVRFSFSSARLSRKALDMLRQRQANVLGLVLNDVNASMPEYGYYNYEYYHTGEKV